MDTPVLQITTLIIHPFPPSSLLFLFSLFLPSSSISSLTSRSATWSAPCFAILCNYSFASMTPWKPLYCEKKESMIAGLYITQRENLHLLKKAAHQKIGRHQELLPFFKGSSDEAVGVNGRKTLQGLHSICHSSSHWVVPVMFSLLIFNFSSSIYQN